jgi:hypothetical protein
MARDHAAGVAKATARLAVLKIINDTRDAYSFDRYGVREWTRCIKMLAKRGYKPIEIEEIMRSKWTRWAGDMSLTPENPTALDLERFLDDPRNKCDQKAVDDLVAGM